MVLDESKGGDALVAKQTVFSDLNALRVKGKKDGQKIAFTPNSPSEHLLKGISRDLGLPLFSEQDSGHWMVKTANSKEALRKLSSGKVAAATLREPYVSEALSMQDMVKLIDTEETNRLIVDVLLVERSYSVKQPQAVQALLSAYFKTLEEYRQDPQSLMRDIKHAKHSSALHDAQIKTMLEGVVWADLADNYSIWFSTNSGIGAAEGIIDTIHLALKIFHYSRDLQGNPLPVGDPYRITNRSFIQALVQEQEIQASPAAQVSSMSFQPDSIKLDKKNIFIMDEIYTLIKKYPILVETPDSEVNRQIEKWSQTLCNEKVCDNLEIILMNPENLDVRYTVTAPDPIARSGKYITDPDGILIPSLITTRVQPKHCEVWIGEIIQVICYII